MHLASYKETRYTSTRNDIRQSSNSRSVACQAAFEKDIPTKIEQHQDW
jgi:hypothetical protein